MQSKLPEFFAALGALVLIAALVVWFAIVQKAAFDPGDSSPRFSVSGNGPPSASGWGEDDPSLSRFRREVRDAMESLAAAMELEELDRILSDKDAIPGEAVLRFDSAEDYADFLKRAESFGLGILGRLPRIYAIRILYESTGDVYDALSGYEQDDYIVGTNYLVSIPTPPDDSEQDSNQELVPFGRSTFPFLGVQGALPPAQWGRGVTIAVLDSGVEPHSTFRPGQVRVVGFDAQPLVDAEDTNGHGTAVASLIAGTDPNAGGLAPGADILSYLVTDARGTSNSFTLAEAIFTAVDDGADIINISLGSFGDSRIVSEAVSYALDRNVLIVAAAGNESAGQLAYPAAYDGVISAGAVDAVSQHANYSNTGETLSVTAPGVGVYAAWLDDSFVTFSGTSASAPLVSGAVGAALSENPNLNPVEAAAEIFVYTDEAGRPGQDEQFGQGILNIGRYMERFERGIYDAAVASQTFADPTVPANLSNPLIDIVLQNRGTETLYNVQATIRSSDTTHTRSVSVLRPTEIATVQAPVDTFKTMGGGASISTKVSIPTMPVTDRNPDNNTQSTLILVNPDSQP